MDIFDQNSRPYIEQKPIKGRILIAEPFLADCDFSRAVVLLCEHGEDGTLGFVINQPTEVTIGDLIVAVEKGTPLTIYRGGPVQPDTLHILHTIPEKLGGVEVCENIYWGGSYEKLQELVKSNECSPNEVKLLVGYSGWTEGQLEDEMKEGAWFVGEASSKLIFDNSMSNLWRQAIISLGDGFRFIANMPIDPNLN